MWEMQLGGKDIWNDMLAFLRQKDSTSLKEPLWFNGEGQCILEHNQLINSEHTLTNERDALCVSERGWAVD